MKTIICAVPWNEDRATWARALALRLNGVVVWDEVRDAYETFQRALVVQGEEDAWHLQDDVILTSRWEQKAQWERQAHPHAILHAFGRVRADIERGSRWMPGRQFMGCLCWFLPGHHVADLAEYAAAWKRPEGVRAHVDIMVAAWMYERKLRFWRIVPSLVQHRDVPSVIGQRAPHRTSPTFVP